MKTAHYSKPALDAIKAGAKAAFGLFHNRPSEPSEAPPTKREMRREMEEYVKNNPGSLASAAIRSQKSENRARIMNSFCAKASKAAKLACLAVPVAVLFAAYSPRHAELFPKPVAGAARHVRNFFLDAHEIATDNPDHALLHIKRAAESSRLPDAEEQYSKAEEMRRQGLVFTYSSMTLGDLMEAARRMEPGHAPSLSFIPKGTDTTLGVGEFMGSADANGREAMLDALRALEAHREWVVDYRAVMNRL